MLFINELIHTLNQHFGWHKSRMTCLVKMICALLLTRTINLNKIACAFESKAAQLSRFRRLQRFFAHFEIPDLKLAQFIFGLFNTEGQQWMLALDRTNWQWGKSPINILTLALVFQGTAIPIAWEILEKKGHSNTQERILLMERFIQHFGKTCIAGVLADREFIGGEWFRWLKAQSIPFYIRIKQNTLTTNAKGLPVEIQGLFYGLQPQEKRVLKGKRTLFGERFFLAGLRSDSKELLIVATSENPEEAIEKYALRWQIETLFGCLKGRGFHFEDTHMTHPARIKNMLAVLSIAFAWAYKTGLWQQTLKPIPLKKHGRASISLFRYGLDYLVNAILKQVLNPQLLKTCIQKLFTLPNFTPLERGR